jgi:hypothetical protein
MSKCDREKLIKVQAGIPKWLYVVWIACNAWSLA